MLIKQLINDVMLGSTYSLIKIGFTPVFGVFRLLLLAHGAAFMIGPFAFLYAVLFMGGGTFTSILAAIVVAAIMSALIEILAIRPIRAHKGHALALMISAIGIGIVLQKLATRFFGAKQVGFPSKTKAAPWHFGSVTVTSLEPG